MSTDEGFIPWLDVVRFSPYKGLIGLVIEVSHHGYEVYIPGFGSEIVPFSVRLFDYDRVKGRLQDDAVAHARDCYKLERIARSKPNLSHFVDAYRSEWTKTLDEGLSRRFLAIHEQISTSQKQT